MVGCKIRSRKRKSEAMAAEEWISGLLRSKFFGSCVDHGEFRKNEKNLFCIDCNLCLCKHCVTSSSPPPLHRCFHRLLQICKYVYRDVVRLHDIQPYLDCSLIQAYKINGEKAVHLNPRPQQKDGNAKSSKTKGGCEACGRHIQDLPNRFCSIACKVQILGGAMVKLETEENSYENGYASFTEESSEVIQTCWSPKQDSAQEKEFAQEISLVLIDIPKPITFLVMEKYLDPYPFLISNEFVFES